ncbi:TetR family transcriptional regulator C-terminal domain-containing protein [Marinomonas communis]|jgi:TetR/AcrR family transcriptional repressor of nem operon|uniref:TetR family transcriptional regulator n=1 Tax=Marinomonas communis TaxID=28254 RepID=A0A4V3DGF4_9GAMM|nr:TetR family transcriptional regulator C-terminal domain-containing protein [Marinomonas communis]TDR14151.1 TetR family transcriptional regulator [Marinomonas communis]
MDSVKNRRGRPKATDLSYQDTQEALLQAGVIWLTQSGFQGTGLEPMLRSVQVPKGSFYHYFESKELFALAVLQRYRSFFEAKLDRYLLDETLPPLTRLRNFIESAKAGMEKYAFKRGCLVGNLEQEATVLPESIRQAVLDTYQSWQNKVADCLTLAQEQGLIDEHADVKALAHVFWVGWEGAVARARLTRSSSPLLQFEKFYLAGLPR